MAALLRGYNQFVLRNPLLAMSLTTGRAPMVRAGLKRASLPRRHHDGLGQCHFANHHRKANAEHGRLAARRSLRRFRLPLLGTVTLLDEKVGISTRALGSIPTLLVLRIGEVLHRCQTETRENDDSGSGETLVRVRAITSVAF